MIKKLFIVFLTLAVVLSLSSCGKIAEKAIEKAINKNSDSKVDVDLNKGEVKVEDDQGNTASIGGTKWPSSDAGKLIPEFKDGDITFVLDASTGASITFDKVTKNEYNAYVSKLKTAGFNVDSYTSESEAALVYGASNKDGDGVMVSYSSKDETMMIVVTVHTN